jgi:hypothetical protein
MFVYDDRQCVLSQRNADLCEIYFFLMAICPD